MARVEPVAQEALPHLAEQFVLVESVMGFVPASMRTMARLPGLTESFGALAAAAFGAGHLSPALVQMVAHVASNASGCRYCQAHTASGAHRAGVAVEKIAAVWEFETDDQFDEAERAALRLARDAAAVPNATTGQHFEDLAKHWPPEAVTQMVAVVATFGFLNRWNDTMATTLEEEPKTFAAQHLTPNGWEPSKHQ
ncbi:MAG TPA: carboxymuconolactone decarboxylase family protein [Acidimicrobiia bacterium]|jgi:AhpD family alkylhydroperoxidase|nr:carboxymuconolactone decarboxylase family protein [Acidimicrobiia bacterium]HIL45702.1 carboxymuconolactone decarboxylase family protein [Acidimicrobiia bacterium]